MRHLDALARDALLDARAAADVGVRGALADALDAYDVARREGASEPPGGDDEADALRGPTRGEIISEGSIGTACPGRERANPKKVQHACGR